MTRSNAVTGAFVTRTCNAAPDPTRPDPTLTSYVPIHLQTATARVGGWMAANARRGVR